MSAHLVGLAIIALPLLLLDLFFLIRKNIPVFILGILTTIVGVGYLATTPAPGEIATMIFGNPAWMQ